MNTFEFQPLDKTHEKSSFDCGSDELNIFLKTRAKQNQLQGFNRTFVTTLKNDSLKKVIGYYSLSMGEIHLSSLPTEQIKKLPKHPVPIARMGRLAVDLKYQGQGLGKYLLVDAMKRIQQASKSIGVFALLVDAKDSIAKSFYEKYGFISLADQDLTLFLPLNSFPK